MKAITDIKAGTNGFNEPIYLFTESGEWWVENHATDWVSESVDSEEKGIELFTAACENNDWNCYR